MDNRKSLAELSDHDWGAPPVNASVLMRERHEFRRTPLGELSDAGLMRLLDLGSDLTLLVPAALDRLRARPEATTLLCALIRADSFPWAAHPELVASVREAAQAALHDLGQFTDETERLRAEAPVLRHWLRFERRLSIVSPLE